MSTDRLAVRRGRGTAAAGSEVAADRRSVRRMEQTFIRNGTHEEPPILICYDGSDVARHAIRFAAEMLGPRAAVVLGIGPLETPGESFMSGLVPENAFAGLNAADARERSREGAALATEAGFNATARAELDACTWDGIVRVADELDSPLIVTGTRAFSAAHELFTGSISHEVVRHAGRPVLVVPPPHHEKRRSGRAAPRRHDRKE